jgi:acetyl-CoA carboxylase biotin carboxylase subunit
MIIRKVLIANRGEIAVRIVRACGEMGIRAVAVYSEADAEAMHVRQADEAAPIGPPPSSESYLRGDRIIEAAKATGADAIHPGYGFLAENADFAEAVRAAGLTFVGPSPEAIRAMGDKLRARAIAQAAGVPVVPEYGRGTVGPHPPSATTPSPVRSGRERGQGLRADYPLLVKASAGGGGRGMRIVRSPDELDEALESAEREARQAFGEGTVFLEKYVESAHHVEFQVLGDEHGHLVHLFERECSVQRRHQKIIEETPSPLLDDDLRGRMAEAALATARAVNYSNAGTVEFIVDPRTREFYFLEMNTRLQVEHPVTEWVTGLDLVKAQLRVAAGDPLPFDQLSLTSRDHAIECRLYAEDPANGFLPDTGRVLEFAEPRGPGVRVDAGVATGDAISHHYDPLIAKISARAEKRPAAILRMQAALKDCALLGLTTNLAFLQDVLAHPVFQRGEAATDFVENHLAHWRPSVTIGQRDAALVAAALAEAQASTAAPAVSRSRQSDEPGLDPWARPDGFRLGAGR